MNRWLAPDNALDARGDNPMTDHNALIAEARELVLTYGVGDAVDPYVYDVLTRLADALAEATRQPTTKTATDAPAPVWGGPH